MNKKIELRHLNVHQIVIAVILILDLITWMVAFNLSENYIISGVIVVIASLIMVFLYLGILQILESIISMVSGKYTGLKRSKESKNVVLEKVGGVRSIGTQNSVDFGDAEFAEIVNKMNEEKNKKLEIAKKYTRVMFHEKISHEDLERLFDYLKEYIEKGKVQKIIPITVQGCNNLDYYHFGWNIWKYFNVGKQGPLIRALKEIFQLKDIPFDTIKSNLKSEYGKFEIVLDPDLSEFQKQLKNLNL